MKKETPPQAPPLLVDVVEVEEMEVEAVGCWMLLATSLVIEIARERAGDGLGADGNNFSTLSHCDGGDLVRLD